MESNCDEEEPAKEEEENASLDQENDAEGQYYIDEEEEEEDQGVDENSSHRPSEGDEYISLPNSELSTVSMCS